jgi:hypothetical protein
VEQSGEDSGDHAAAGRIEGELLACLRLVFPAIKLVEPGAGAGGTSTLVIEPSIPDMKKVNFSERFWLGPMAGSSAVLLRTRYTDAATGEVVAEPTFYAKANAWGGAFSFAATDNKMLTRLVNDACSYGRRNL